MFLPGRASRRPALLLVPLAVLAAAGLGACPRAQDARRPNVLLVLLDTVRADKLGCYGNERGLTPALDRLAREGTLFEHATSHAPWTLPATASLLTSLPPPRHGAGGHLPQLTALSPDATTLAEVERSSGAATAEIANVAFLGERFGLTRGFEQADVVSFEDNQHLRRADETTTRALEWLAARKAEPFFLLVHYFDAHALYDPPQPFRRRFALAADSEAGAFAFGSREDMLALRTGERAPEPELIERAEALYDGEIAFVDSEVGRLLEGLRELGLAGNTLLVVTADHGEEFLDHGGFEHGHTHYAELLDVPLILRGPGVPAGARVSANVGHVDVAPTLLELQDIAVPRAFEGRSLAPLLHGKSQARGQLAYGNFWGPPLASLRSDDVKVIVHPSASGHAPELFRWRDDPREQRDLAASVPGELLALEKALSTRLRDLRSGNATPGSAVELDAEARKALDELGYTESRRPNDR